MSKIPTSCGALAFALATQALAVSVASSAPAQQPGQPGQQELRQQRRAEKLAKPVFQRLPWRTDFEAAKQEARERDTLLLTYFTRSYAP